MFMIRKKNEGNAVEERGR